MQQGHHFWLAELLIFSQQKRHPVVDFLHPSNTVSWNKHQPVQVLTKQVTNTGQGLRLSIQFLLMVSISCEVLGSCWFSRFSFPIPHAFPVWGSLALCILQTAWHKGISQDLSWGLKALLKFLFIFGHVLYSSFPWELAISFQSAECRLLSPQQRVVSISLDACQQPLTHRFFIARALNAWWKHGYSFPTGFVMPKNWSILPRHKSPEPKVCRVWYCKSCSLKESRFPRSRILTSVSHFWRLSHSFCREGDAGTKCSTVLQTSSEIPLLTEVWTSKFTRAYHAPWPHHPCSVAVQRVCLVLRLILSVLLRISLFQSWI